MKFSPNAAAFASLSENLSDASNEVNQASRQISSISNNISYSTGALIAQAASNLDEAAQMISNTIAAGISIDLDAASQGMGFDSFAEAVNAYNQQYGTNYTVQSAKEALGQ